MNHRLFEIYEDADVCEVIRMPGPGSSYKVHTTNGRARATDEVPVLATGFQCGGGARQLAAFFFEWNDDGYPVLTDEDCSTLFLVCTLSALMCGMPVIFIALSISSVSAFPSWQKVSRVIWACPLKEYGTGGFCLQSLTAVPMRTVRAEVRVYAIIRFNGIRKCRKIYPV